MSLMGICDLAEAESPKIMSGFADVKF
jgi:hypothetical protein